MEIILKQRGEGKTSYLIRKADNFNGYIVVADSLLWAFVQILHYSFLIQSL